MKKSTFIFFLTIYLSACSTSHQTQAPTQPSLGLCGEHISKRDGMTLSIAKQNFQNGLYLSSLANLEHINNNLISKKALQASAYRKSGQLEEAKNIYNKLLNSCLDGNAAHGLGLVAAYQGNMLDAKHWFTFAISKQPTNANIQNDFGFLLFSLGEVEKARHQFLTALELDPQHQIAAKNLWLALLNNGEHVAAEKLRSRFEWDEGESDKFANAAKQFTPIALKDDHQ